MKEFFLASYPRSGNTMTRLLLEHHFDIDTRETFKMILRERSDQRDPQRPDLEQLVDERYDTAGVAYKTHHHDSKDLPALVLVRDGRDALVSYAHYSIDLKGAPAEYSTLLFTRTKTKRWSDFYNWWVGGRPGKAPYVLITYEQLLKHQAKGTSAKYLQTALSKIGFSFEIINTTPLPSFDKYHKAKPEFFRRGVVGSWKDEMSPEVEEHFWKIHGTTMNWLGYER